jgi:hypothetical protein
MEWCGRDSRPLELSRASNFRQLELTEKLCNQVVIKIEGFMSISNLGAVNLSMYTRRYSIIHLVLITCIIFPSKIGCSGNIGYIKAEDIEFNNGNGYVCGNILATDKRKVPASPLMWN